MDQTSISAPAAARNLCDLFVRELHSLIDTSEGVTHGLRALRTECRFATELTESLDLLATVNDTREVHLRRPVAEAGLSWERAADFDGTSVWMEQLFPRLPPGSASDAQAADVAVKLRLLAQHLELRTVLAAESALLLGREPLCQGLIAWADQWHACCQSLRLVTVHARMRAFVADLAKDGTPSDLDAA